MQGNGEDLTRRFDELHEKYSKPFEADHQGEFLAISQDGRTILGGRLREVAWEATEAFGPGNFVYKIEERAVGRWR